MKQIDDFYFKRATVEVLTEMPSLGEKKRYIRIADWHFESDDEFGPAEACNFFENSKEPDIFGKMSGGTYIVSLRASRTGEDFDEEEIAIHYPDKDIVERNDILYKLLEESCIPVKSDEDCMTIYKAYIEGQ